MTNNSKQSKQLNIFLKDLTNRKLYPNPTYMLHTCWNFKYCALYDKWRDGVDSFTLEKFISIVHNNSDEILIATQQGAHAFPSSIASIKNINTINNEFGGKLCWNCHRTFDFWGAKGSKIRVNEENASYVKLFKEDLLNSFGEIYRYYGL
tara:strand:- start:553 stop:1002 length:450 start_codon:yes stop_codon:yes gene_type:complete